MNFLGTLFNRYRRKKVQLCAHCSAADSLENGTMVCRMAGKSVADIIISDVPCPKGKWLGTSSKKPPLVKISEEQFERVFKPVENRIRPVVGLQRGPHVSKGR